MQHSTQTTLFPSSKHDPTPAHSRSESRLWAVAGVVRPRDKPAPHDPGLTESLFHYNFVIVSYLKDGEGAMTWKKKSMTLR